MPSGRSYCAVRCWPGIPCTALTIFLLVFAGTASDARTRVDLGNNINLQDHNVIPNPSFEKGKDQPAHWSQKTHSGWKIVRYLWDTRVKHSGRRSVMIASYPPQKTCWGSWVTELEITGGIPWYFSAWGKIQKSTKSGLLGWIWNEGHSPVSFMSFGGDSDWSYSGKTVDMPEGTYTIRIGMEFRYSNGRAWADDVLVAPYFLKLIADMQALTDTFEGDSLPKNLARDIQAWQDKLDDLASRANKWRGKSADVLKQLNADANELKTSLVDLQNRVVLANLKKPIEVRFYDSLTSIYQQPAELPPSLFDEAIDIYALKGEVEAFQVALLAAKEDVSSITVDVKLPHGFEVETYRLDHVIYKTGQQAHGNLWPDVLAPAEKFKLTQGKVLPVWVDIKIPADKEAGVYEGMILVQRNGRLVHKEPLRVHVANYTLPRPTTMKVAMTTVPNYRVYHELNEKEKIKKIGIERVRLLSDHQLRSYVKYQKVDFMLELFKIMREEYGFTALGTEGLKPDDWKKLYDIAVEEGWNEGLYYNVWDEAPGDGAVPKYAAFKKAYPQARALLVLSSHLTAIRPYKDVVDIWCPDTTNLSLDTEFHDSREHRWWYFCTSGMITNPLQWRMSTGVGAWKHNRNGFFYYCAIAGSGRYNFKDGQWSITDDGGNGGVAYPDPRSDIHLYPALRLKHVRDGVEDWELMNIAKENLSPSAYNELMTDVKKLSQVEFDNPEAYEKAIRQVRSKAFELLQKTE